MATDVSYLIQLLNNKLVVLKNARVQSFNSGDLEAINALDEEVLSVENTLSQLQLLLTINTAATAVNATPADVVASGVGVIQNPVQGPSAGAIINGYNVSAYATDALYEQKIQTIVSTLPVFVEAFDVDVYIQDRAPGSGVTGDMVFAATNQYSIDLPLLVAIMQNDSQFGTKGVGATTFNPGNVGNTGSATHSFASWEEGVMAVAEWLSRHKVV
jgi:hypothetical protein